MAKKTPTTAVTNKTKEKPKAETATTILKQKYEKTKELIAATPVSTAKELNQYDICIVYQENCVTLKFVDVDSASTLKFTSSRDWISQAEFPTPVEIHRFLETHYNKAQNWFADVYMPAFFDECDRICKTQYNKVFTEVFGQDRTEALGFRVLLWLFFVAKELKRTQLPAVHPALASNP